MYIYTSNRYNHNNQYGYVYCISLVQEICKPTIFAEKITASFTTLRLLQIPFGLQNETIHICRCRWSSALGYTCQGSSIVQTTIQELGLFVQYNCYARAVTEHFVNFVLNNSFAFDNI